MNKSLMSSGGQNGEKIANSKDCFHEVLNRNEDSFGGSTRGNLGYVMEKNCLYVVHNLRFFQEAEFKRDGVVYLVEEI